jgi:hypothetical protein
MTKIRPDRPSWDLAPRFKDKRTGKPLTRFALDLSIRFSDGVWVTDFNSNKGLLRFGNAEELCEFLTEKIKRHDVEGAALIIGGIAALIIAGRHKPFDYRG